MQNKEAKEALKKRTQERRAERKRKQSYGGKP